MDSRSLRHIVRRGFFASALALASWGLVLPPAVLAGLPQHRVESFTVTESETGVSRDFVLQDDGSYLWFGSDGQRGEVPVDLIQAADVLDVRQSGGQLSVKLGIEDGLGGDSVYAFNGLLGEPGGPIQGFVTAPSGGTTAIEIGIGDADIDTVDPVTIILVATGVGLLGCLYGTLASDCLNDCAAACQPYGMISSSEGFCGNCNCSCNPAP